MTTYRKKPVDIEAFQMTPERRDSNEHWPNWLHEAWNTGDVWIEGELLMIRTLEGVMTAQPHDYIIQGVRGELYPCKPGIFEQTYDRALKYGDCTAVVGTADQAEDKA